MTVGIGDPADSQSAGTADQEAVGSGLLGQPTAAFACKLVAPFPSLVPLKDGVLPHQWRSDFTAHLRVAERGGPARTSSKVRQNRREQELKHGPRL